MEINEILAKKVLSIVDHGLVSGLGSPVPGKMCVEAAVSYALGEPHSDNPSCVDPVLRTLKIDLNDCNWSSPAARAAGMRQLAIAQLGSKDNFDQVKFAKMVSEMTIRKILPMVLRKAGLEAEALRCETEGTKEAANSARYAANSAYSAAYSVKFAAQSAAYSAAYSAAKYAAFAAESAAKSVAAVKVAYSARFVAGKIESYDNELSYFAEEVVKILVDMKVLGTKYLYLTEG